MKKNLGKNSIDLADYSIHAWIQKNGIKNEKGDPIEFRKHLFLFDIYRDNSPHLVVMKAAQIGMSTLEILKNIYNAKQKKIDIIYTLPTDNDVQVFVGGKVNRIISQNPILQSYTHDKDTIEQKKIHDSMLYFRGTWTSKSAIMVTADRLVHDEIDSSKQDIVKDYQSRLQHSKYKEIHVFSHPSAPGVGVDVYWKLSDQKHWFIKCPHCKEEQFMHWPESFDLDRKLYVCKYCKGELSNDDRRRGRWVQKFKDAKYSGYWIPLFITPWTTAAEIIDKYNDPKTTEEFFYNKVLGLPYAGSGNIVSQEVIFQNLTQKINEQKGRIVIGVDTGIDLRYVIGNEEGIFYYGQTKTYGDIERLLKRWERSVVVIDQGGDIIGSRKLREDYPGRVFLCFYQRDKSNKELVTWGKEKEIGRVRADRNRMIQLVIDEFTDKRIKLYGTENDWWDYWLHWSHIYRVKEENNLGVMEYRWLRSDRDDWVHATVYWRIGMGKFGQTGDIVGSEPILRANSFEIAPDMTAPNVRPDQIWDFTNHEEDEWR